ncbi:MAG: GGDEF domain-containing protein [Gammaproteobacteria bacterium]|nr:GGDEF domain-containing protein [Gammaproteobacteria bacterium]
MLSIRPLRKRTATLLAILMAAVALRFDLTQPLGVSAGIPYVVLPLLGLLARSSLLIIAAAVLGTVLVGIGMWLSPPGVEFQVVLLNRVMSAGLIWATAVMGLRHLYVGNSLQQKLRDLAATDPLTGLYNRRHVFEILRQELKRYERYRESFALILIDADHFKQVNDSYGHAVGDATLRFIADTCAGCVRETDVVGRFGGEEFIILLPHTNNDEALIVAERIRLAMHNSDIDTRGGAAKVTLSLGVTEARPGNATFDDILKAADDALYEAKRDGRDRVATLVMAGTNARKVHAVQ